jgi:ACS family glucarate transporter-like MFS transporter/ACS family D-galactonate transporter-like MFS transporter
VTEIIDRRDQPPTNVRYIVLSWLSVAAVLAYFVRNSVGLAEKPISQELDLSKFEMGFFLGAFFWSYALFQIPAGYLGQRFGTRRVLGWSAVTWSLGLLLLGGANNLVMLVASQIFIGLAQAAAFPCAVQSLSTWFPKSRRARACSGLAIGMQVGAVITALVTAQLIGDWKWDWRWVFFVYAAPGLFWAVLFFASFHDRPEEDPRLNAAELELIRSTTGMSASPANPKPGPTPWGLILANRSVLCLCGQQALRAAGYGFFATWFPSFLQKTRNIDVEASGLFQGVVFAATLLGGISGGLLVDWIYTRTQNLKASRSGVGVLCMLCCGGLIFSAAFATSTGLAVGLIALGAFASALAGPCAYVTTIDLGKQHLPAVFGFMNMSGNLLAFACSVLVGYLFDQTSNWNIVLPLFGIAYLVAACCWSLVDPNQSVEDNPVLKENL